MEITSKPFAIKKNEEANMKVGFIGAPHIGGNLARLAAKQDMKRHESSRLRSNRSYLNNTAMTNQCQAPICPRGHTRLQIPVW
jgi:phosphoglycerate dehydrogenase-like enzyme